MAPRVRSPFHRIQRALTRMSRRSSRALCVLFGAVLLFNLYMTVGAQMTSAEHASHHPGDPAMPSTALNPLASPATQPASPPMPPATLPTAPAAGGMGDMGAMMKGMGTAPTKEIYPTLMALPDGLTPEDQDKILRLAHQRKKEGTEALSSGLGKLSEATANNDYLAMQEASEQMRGGMADFDSGVAGERVIAEGKLPRNVALDWFRREMNLASPTANLAAVGWFGVSPFHLLTMILLVGFAFAMLAMYFFKMRRAAALFGRLDPDKKPPPGSSSGPASPGAAGPTPPSSPPAASPPSPLAVPPVAPSSTSVAAQAPNAPNAPNESTPTPAPPAQGAPASDPVTANWKGQLRIGSIIVETPTVKTFRLVPACNDQFLPFTFLPGQFLNVTFWIGGAKMNRSYSISSSPNEHAFVDLTIRREPRGAVSRHIDDLLRAGDLVETGGPVGKFTFTGAEAKSVVLLSGGVGITPMMSISRYLTERSWDGDIFFVHTCRTPADYIFANLIPELQKRNPRLKVAVTVSSPEGSDWAGARGRITKEWLTEMVPDLGTRQTHLCGPPAMMDSMRAIFNELGIPPEQLKTEAFGAVKPAVPPPGTARKIGPATGPLVTFSKNGKSAKVHMDLQMGDSPPNQSILELSEELGIGIEFSCRVGTCGLCKVKMTAGTVDMEVQDALDPDDKAKNMILACQAKPTSDVTVEA